MRSSVRIPGIARIPGFARTVGLLGILGLSAVPPAEAQPPEPVGPFAVDVRGTLVRFKGDAAVASALEVPADSLPTRGLGIAAGAHWYPLGRGRVTLGIGGELVVARGSRSAEATTAVPAPPTVNTRFSSFSPQLSLNFGNRDGWSYVSGGIGRARLSSERDDQPFAQDAGRVRSINYGGGARWFTGPRLAFTFDVRFYTMNAQPAEGARPGHPRTRFMAFTAGVSFR